MKKYTATQVTKKGEVVLASNTFLRKALFAIIRDARGYEYNSCNVCRWAFN